MCGIGLHYFKPTNYIMNTAIFILQIYIYFISNMQLVLVLVYAFQYPLVNNIAKNARRKIFSLK